MLKNYQKDIIGYLRSVNVILILWNISPIIFPLDFEIKNLLTKLNFEWENLLDLVCQISKMKTYSEYKEIRSAIDDILDEKQIYYDEEEVALLLILYSGIPKFRKFSYNCKRIFFQETMPIFARTLRMLFDAMLWGRVYFYDTNFSNSCANKSYLHMLEMLELISKLVPKELSFSEPKVLLKEVLSWWLDSETTQKGLSLTKKDKEKNGLLRVTQEVKTILSDFVS